MSFLLNAARTHRRNGICLVAIAMVATVGMLLLSASATSDDRSAGLAPENAAIATFAGGCFWCMEHPFDALDGVYSTTSGYMGGSSDNPDYKQVSAGGSGHVEVVQIKYNPDIVSYGRLLDVYWRNIDPLTANAQFCDKGSQYRSAIFTHGEDQQRLAEQSLSTLEVSGRFDQPIVTDILSASAFWPAEDYHQDYYLKNPLRYKLYRTACGRDKRLDTLWGDAS